MVKFLNKDENKAITELKDLISKKYKVVDMILFGSKTRGDFDKDSDLDIFIVLEKSNWDTRMEIFEVCFNLSLKYDLLLSPIVYAKEDLEKKLIKFTPFYKTVAKEGIRL